MPRGNYYLVERYNPQLGVYYIKLDQCGVEKAEEWVNGSVYGSNTYETFRSKKAYSDRIAELESNGMRVR